MIKLFEEFDTDDPPILKWIKSHYTNYKDVTFFNYEESAITTLEGIENLINLETLHISKNRLNSLKGIENLIHLKDLFCANNKKIDGLEELKKLVNLEKLYCGSNIISSMEGTERLANLQVLSIGRNLLENFEYDNTFSMDALELGIDETDLCKLKSIVYINCLDNKFSERYKRHIINYCRRKNIQLYI